MSFFEGCPGSKRIREPFPENIECGCGKEIEIWSDEAETTCPYCKKKASRNMPQSCLDWCKMAKDCVGLDKFEKYKKHKDGDLTLTMVLSWFEQKAVAILLSLLYLDIRGMYIGPTPPAFISKNVFGVLQQKFDLKLIGDPKKDMEEMLKK